MILSLEEGPWSFLMRRMASQKMNGSLRSLLSDVYYAVSICESFPRKAHIPSVFPLQKSHATPGHRP